MHVSMRMRGRCYIVMYAQKRNPAAGRRDVYESDGGSGSSLLSSLGEIQGPASTSPGARVSRGRGLLTPQPALLTGPLP